MAEYVLTLVHGTWADTDGWVAPGSALRCHLEQRLASVAFREFPWSGANTHAARLEAGVRLAQFIRDGQTQHPAARHFVVAHSHGGNVALYAMRDPAAREAVDGIVTLATPFFHTRRRSVRRHVPFATSLLLAAPMVLAFVLLYGRSSRLAGASMIAALLLGVRIQPMFARWVIDAIRRQQRAIVAALQPPSIERSRLLILCTRRDEARGWLDAWDVFTQAPFVVVGLLLSLLNVLAYARLYNMVADILGALAWTLILGIAIASAIGGVWLLCSGIMRWPAYWREPLGANLFVQIGTDRTPRGVGVTLHAAQVMDVPPRVPLRPAGPLSRITRRRLLHTAICDDAPALSVVADWIAERAWTRAGARVSRSGEPAIRRGKNALPADDPRHTFIFRAACGALASRYASSAFLLPHCSRRLEGSPLLDTRALRMCSSGSNYALSARTAGRSAAVGIRNALAGTAATATELPVMSKNSTE